MQCCSAFLSSTCTLQSRLPHSNVSAYSSTAQALDNLIIAAAVGAASASRTAAARRGRGRTGGSLRGGRLGAGRLAGRGGMKLGAAKISKPEETFEF